jgi:putative DNA primase/helicase
MNTPPIATGGRVNPAVAELAGIPRWVVWKLEHVKGRPKPTKVPYLPAARKKASSTDSRTWNDFDTCWRSAFVDGAAPGIGVVVDGSDDLMAADLDDCIVVPETLTITAEASEIVQLLNSYTEVSPSGSGLRVFFYSPRDAVDWGHDGKAPKGGRAITYKGEKLELYRFGRFLTVTGSHLPGTPETINDVAPEIIARLLDPPGRKPNGGANTGAAEHLDGIPEPSEELRARFKAALRADADLREVWRGEAPPAGADQTRSAWDLKLAGALRRQSGFTLQDFAAIASRWQHGKGADGDPRHWSRTWAKAEPQSAPEVLWPDPLPLPEGLPPVEQFPLELLPDAFRPWVADAADRMQIPPDYIAIGIMVAAGAVIGRQIGIRPKRFDDWTVVPNLWGAVIGRPGVLKTPSLEEALRPIRALESDARAQHEKEQRVWKARVEIEAEAKRLRGQKIREQLKSHRRNLDALAREIADDQTEIPEPVRRRFITNDATVEKLGELLRDNPNGIILFRDELMGWLKTLEQEGRGADRAFYLESWNGTGRFSYDRIGRGTIDIEAACVSVLGSIQPGPLLAYLDSKAWDDANADGLLQRFQLAVWPDPQPTWRNVDDSPDAAAKDRATAVFQRLAAISPDGKTRTLRFDGAAQDAFDAWRATLEQRLRAGDLHPAFEAHLAKYRSLLPALALICHLVDHDQKTPVGAISVSRAETWLEYLESHAVRIYDCLIRPDQSAARALGERIAQGVIPSPFSLRDVYRKNWSGLTTRETAQEAVDVLADLNWLRAEEIRTSSRGGRPTSQFHVNPKVRK